MAATSTSAQVSKQSEWSLTPTAAFPSLRALAWAGDVLYASRGYELLSAKITSSKVDWQFVSRHRPAWWRNLTASSRLSFRLCRDGFHALTVLPSGGLVAAVPGAIVTLAPGEREFRTTHTVTRGTRPLHITVTPAGQIFWGEYFSNPQRDEVHIYASNDQAASWSVAYTFPRGSIRHIHNIVYDQWRDCLWILTGDDGDECRILRATCDLSAMDVVLAGNQQARTVALVPSADAVYFSSDTPFEENHIYRLDRKGNLTRMIGLVSSSIYGCSVGASIFFSTMAEPSSVNTEQNVCVYASRGGENWQPCLQWKKDRWPMKWFQFGNAFLPDGVNTSNFLAVTTVATQSGDLETGLWRVP